jgi:hypothetical protein
LHNLMLLTCNKIAWESVRGLLSAR